MIHVQRGRYADAAESLRRAVATRPDFAAAYGNLAVAYVHLKQYKEAAEAAGHAVRLSPADAEAHFNLGLASLEQGDREEALRQYDALVPLDRPRADRLKMMIDAKAK